MGTRPCRRKSQSFARAVASRSRIATSDGVAAATGEDHRTRREVHRRLTVLDEDLEATGAVTQRDDADGRARDDGHSEVAAASSASAISSPSSDSVRSSSAVISPERRAICSLT